MRLLVVLFLAVFAAGCGPRARPDQGPVSDGVKGAAERGDEIIAEHLKRDASPYRRDRVRFTVRSEGEPVDVYEVDVWRRQSAGETTTLSLIVKPDEDAGSGSLTIETPGKPTVNITYSASRQEFRETDTGKMFFGGLTIQELLGEWGKYAYRFVGESDLDGSKVFEADGKLREGERSIITSTKVLFEAQNYLPVEVHLFGAGGKELRTYRKSELKTEGARVYVAKTEVDNHVYNSHITIEILSREWPERVDDAMFSREKLKEGEKR